MHAHAMEVRDVERQPLLNFTTLRSVVTSLVQCRHTHATQFVGQNLIVRGFLVAAEIRPLPEHATSQ